MNIFQYLDTWFYLGRYLISFSPIEFFGVLSYYNTS